MIDTKLISQDDKEYFVENVDVFKRCLAIVSKACTHQESKTQHIVNIAGMANRIVDDANKEVLASEMAEKNKAAYDARMEKQRIERDKNEEKRADRIKAEQQARQTGAAAANAENAKTAAANQKRQAENAAAKAIRHTGNIVEGTSPSHAPATIPKNSAWTKVN